MDQRIVQKIIDNYFNNSELRGLCFELEPVREEREAEVE